MLALPVELLQRVTDNLGDETLTTFRLTCKAIEAATFDQFAKIFFEERYYYIYEKPRWTLLNNIVSSRLADRIRKVVFTTKVLAPACFKQLQLAPKQDRNGCSEQEWAQIQLRDSMVDAMGPEEQIPAWPSAGTIERCLIDIRNLHLTFASSLFSRISIGLNTTKHALR